MWKNTIHVLLIVLGINVFGVVAIPQTNPPENATPVTNTTPFEKYNSFKKMRADAINYLISVVKDKTNAEYPDEDILRLAKSTRVMFPLYEDYGGAEYMAISTLGNFRAKEAIDVLSEKFLFIPRLIPSGNIRQKQAYYPCATALVEIGEPALPNMIQKIEVSKSIEEQHLAAWVIMSIEGKEQAIFRLNELSKNEKGNSIERLQQASEYLKDFQPSIVPPGSDAANMEEYFKGK